MKKSQMKEWEEVRSFQMWLIVKSSSKMFIKPALGYDYVGAHDFDRFRIVKNHHYDETNITVKQDVLKS